MFHRQYAWTFYSLLANTTQLVKYPRVLFTKTPNEVQVFSFTIKSSWYVIKVLKLLSKPRFVFVVIAFPFTWLHRKWAPIATADNARNRLANQPHQVRYCMHIKTTPLIGLLKDFVVHNKSKLIMFIFSFNFGLPTSTIIFMGFTTTVHSFLLQKY